MKSYLGESCRRSVPIKSKIASYISALSLAACASSMVYAQQQSEIMLIDELFQIERDLEVDLEFDSAILEGVVSPDIKVKGVFEPSQYIKNLVEAAGFKVGYKDSTAYILKPNELEKSVASGELSRFPSYAFEQTLQIEEIIVTGSRLRRGTQDSVDVVRVLGRDIAKARGAQTITDALLTSSVVSGTPSNNRTASSFSLSGTGGAREVDLRGLGGDRTLVLVNGRAVPPGGVGVSATTTDLSSLPSAITDRIEILTQGASSVYGSEALAGTVNYVTDSDLEGFRLTLDGNMPTDSGGEQATGSIAYGKKYEKGSVLVAYEYNKQKALKWGDRNGFRCEISPTRDPITGRRTDIDQSTGLPRCVDAFYAIASFESEADDPTSFNVVQLRQQAGAQFGGIDGYQRLELREDADGNPIVIGATNDVSSTRPNVDLQGEDERHNLFLQADLNTELFGGTRFYIEGGYATSSNSTVSEAAIFDVSLDSDNALNPWSQGFENPDVEPGNLGISVPNRFYTDAARSESDSGRIVLGAEGILPIEGWRWSVDYQYGETASSVLTPVLSAARVEQALNAERDENGNLVCADNRNGCVVFNPLDMAILSGRGPIDPRLSRFLVTNAKEETTTSRSEWTAIIDGNIFSIPSGDVSAALGLNYRTDQVEHDRSQVLRDNDVFSSLLAVETIDKAEIDTFGVFGEVEVPIVRGRKWADDVTVNLSGRYTEDEVFDNFSYKASGLYAVTPYVALRASFSTSFRSPNLFERFRRQDVSPDDFRLSSSIDPCDVFGFFSEQDDVLFQNCVGQGLDPDFEGRTPTALLVGANPQLQPEEGESIILGLHINSPDESTSLGVTYFDIEVENSIQALSVEELLTLCYNSVNLSSPFCSPQFIGARDSNGFLTRVDARDRNASVNSVSGLDFELSFYGTYSDVAFSAHAEATYLISRETQQVEGASVFDLAGGIDFPEWKANLILGATYRNIDVSYDIRYIGGVDQADLDPTFFATSAGRRLISSVDDFFYHNLSASYQLSDVTSISLGINNLFDKKPPIVSNVPTDGPGSIFTTAGVPFGEYDLLGRSVVVRFETQF